MGSHVMVAPIEISLTERATLCILDVIVALLADGVPIQSAEPSPLILIFRIVVALGQ